MKYLPVCHKVDCFGCKDGRCMILTKRLEDCPFYKTKLQAKRDAQAAYDRLMSIPGGDVLYREKHYDAILQEGWAKK